MGWLITTVVMVIIFGVCLFISGAKDRRGNRVFSPWIAVAVAISYGLMTLAFSVNTVPIRNVGIVTSFNRPTGETTGSGLKLVAPWKKVQEWDASVQTSDHAAADRCVTVRIGSMATACVETKVRWQVRPEAAPEQFMAYKGEFDNMKNNLFETELQNALNEAMADYNPINTIDIQSGQTKFDGTDLADEVKALLQNRVGSQIIIESAVIPIVHHDAKTEENIKAFQDVIAQKRILEQRQQNAATERAAAEILSSLPPEYTINKCLDLAKELNREPGLCMGGVTPIWSAK